MSQQSDKEDIGINPLRRSLLSKHRGGKKHTNRYKNKRFSQQNISSKKGTVFVICTGSKSNNGDLTPQRKAKTNIKPKKKFKEERKATEEDEEYNKELLKKYE